jgi:6-pyruvoyltetrahydropterin/6-carboxytetrahydropterin synthase
MLTITRRHSICAGHRVVGQKDSSENPGPCTHLHGHQYFYDLVCSSEELNDIGMILDFSEIKKRLCSWLDDSWDHRMLIWDRDPWKEELAKIDSSVVWISFNPTAERMAEYMVKEIGPKLLEGTGVTLISCTVHETDKCEATFSL